MNAFEIHPIPESVTAAWLSGLTLAATASVEAAERGELWDKEYRLWAGWSYGLLSILRAHAAVPESWQKPYRTELSVEQAETHAAFNYCHRHSLWREPEIGLLVRWVIVSEAESRLRARLRERQYEKIDSHYELDKMQTIAKWFEEGDGCWDSVQNKRLTRAEERERDGVRLFDQEWKTKYPGKRRGTREYRLKLVELLPKAVAILARQKRDTLRRGLAEFRRLGSDSFPGEARRLQKEWSNQLEKAESLERSASWLRLFGQSALILPGGDAPVAELLDGLAQEIRDRETDSRQYVEEAISRIEALTDKPCALERVLD